MLLKKRAFARPSVAVAVVSLLTLPAQGYAQNLATDPQDVDQNDLEPSLSQAPPPQVGTTRLDQQFTYNGVSLGFEEGVLFDLGLQASNDQNTVLRGTLTDVGNVEREQAFEQTDDGQRFMSRQSALIFQLDTTDDKRVVTQTFEEAGDLIGFRLDLSLTGQCILPGSTAGSFCSYTPGIATIDGAIDPDLLVPNDFLISSDVGEEISEELHDSLFADGFQRGEDIAGGPLVGISFDVINGGFAPDANPSNLSASRTEDTSVRFVPSLAQVEQTLATNSTEAAATRSVRAFVLPDDDDDDDDDEIDDVYLLMQLAAFALPTANAQVAYTDGRPNTNVSNNLFLAMSNARVPAESYTIFQTGRADVTHSDTPPRSAAETPVAQYRGIWMGMSPVRTDSTTQRLQFVQTGDRISINPPVFEQGGIGTPFEDLLDLDITLIDQFDQSITAVDFQNVDDLFVQFGLDVTNQDAIRRLTTTSTIDYALVPHLAFDGNRTGGESVFRYYAGVLFADETNAYVGADYSLSTESGWDAYARLDLYSAPDIDYKSELELRGSRTYRINPDRQIIVGASSLIGLDNQVLNNGIDQLDDPAQLNIFGRWQEGPASYSISHRLSSNEIGESDTSTTLGVRYQIDNRVSLTAQATPWSTQDSFIDAAIGANFRMDELPGEPVLNVQIARARYEIGSSSFGETVGVTDTVLNVGFKFEF